MMAGRVPDVHEIIIPSHEVLIDKSEEGLLGRGGYGSVYIGKYREMKVAVKMCSEEGHLTKKQRHDLRKEAKRLREACEHPNILNLIGIIMETNNYSLVLEYMHFGTAFRFVKNYIVGVPLRVQFAQQIISAMAWLHSRTPPVKHLDLKADNVLINNYFIAKICDFGLSEWKTVTTLISKTQPLDNGARCGTYSHIPPEVFLDINKKGAVEEDVYAFAITLWEIFSGEVPFKSCANNCQLISNAVLHNQRPDLSHLHEQCPPLIKQMIELSWDYKPECRPTFKALESTIATIYNSVQAEIPAVIRYIRAQIVENYLDDPECVEQYECTKHFDEENGTLHMNGHAPNGMTNGDASPDGDKGSQSITVPPDLPSSSNENFAHNSHGTNLENKFSQLALNQQVHQMSTQNPLDTPTRPDPQTLRRERFNTPPRPAVVAPIHPAQHASGFGITPVQRLPNDQSNLGPAHVPIDETRQKQTDNDSVRNRGEPDSSFLSGFVSVRDKQYTPGSKMPHPHGPVAQPVSAVLLSETGRRAVEGEYESNTGDWAVTSSGAMAGESEGTSLKGDPASQFLNDLSISNPDLYQTLMKSPEALENVLSVVESGRSILGASSRPSELSFPASRRATELSHPAVGTQPRPAHSCAGEVNPGLTTFNTVSVDQFSGQSSDARRAEAEAQSRQQTSAAAGSIRMFPQGGHNFGSAATQHEPVVRNQLPTTIASSVSNAPPNVSTSSNMAAVQPVGQAVGPSQFPAQRQIFGQPARAHPVQPLKVQIPGRSQIAGTGLMIQPSVFGTQQAVPGAGSQAAAVNNSVFGQQSYRGSQSQTSVQPVSNSRLETRQGIVQQSRLVPQRQPPVLQEERQAVQNSMQQARPAVQNSMQQARPAVQQTTHSEPAQLTQEMPNATQRPYQTRGQQTTLPSMSKPHVRSPVEASYRLRPEQGSPRQSQPTNQKNAAPSEEELRQQPLSASPKQPITLHHKHVGGGTTTITMGHDAELPPNLQIGNNNYMVVNGGGDKKKSEKNKKPKCKKSQLTTSIEELTMDHIDMVSVEIGKDWKRLCRELDMTEADIEQLQFDYHISGLYEIMYQGIQRWIQRNGRAATVRRMAEALWEIDRDDIALRLH